MLSTSAEKIKQCLSRWNKGGWFVDKAENYREAVRVASVDPDALEELIFSSQSDERLDWLGRSRSWLFELGGHAASCNRRHNERWIFFHERLRFRWSELSVRERHTLDWYKKTHDW